MTRKLYWMGPILVSTDCVGCGSLTLPLWIIYVSTALCAEHKPPTYMYIWIWIRMNIQNTIIENLRIGILVWPQWDSNIKPLIWWLCNIGILFNVTPWVVDRASVTPCYNNVRSFFGHYIILYQQFMPYKLPFWQGEHLCTSSLSHGWLLFPCFPFLTPRKVMLGPY